MKILKHRETVQSIYYVHEYGMMRDNGKITLCSGFDCDAMGNIDLSKLMPAALDNLRECRAGQRDDGTKLYDLGIQRREGGYTMPAIGQCDCGTEVTLDGFTNTCSVCNADYNMSGQRLAHRSQWGEETSETADDILNCDYSSSLDDTDY